MFNVKAKAGRTILRVHTNQSPEDVIRLIAEEVAYTIGGGGVAAATKLDIDPVAGGTRWEVVILQGRIIQPLQGYDPSGYEVNENGAGEPTDPENVQHGEQAIPEPESEPAPEPEAELVTA